MMRHRLRGRVQPRGVTTRRLAAARRALTRERDRLALFAAEVAADQETPQQRIERSDLQLLAQDQAHRDLAAAHWRWGRRLLMRVAPAVRCEILERWNASWIPADAAYFADFVRRELTKRGIRCDDPA